MLKARQETLLSIVTDLPYTSARISSLLHTLKVRPNRSLDSEMHSSSRPAKRTMKHVERGPRITGSTAPLADQNHTSNKVDDPLLQSDGLVLDALDVSSESEPIDSSRIASLQLHGAITPTAATNRLLHGATRSIPIIDEPSPASRTLPFDVGSTPGSPPESDSSSFAGAACAPLGWAGHADRCDSHAPRGDTTVAREAAAALAVRAKVQELLHMEEVISPQPAKAREQPHDAKGNGGAEEVPDGAGPWATSPPVLPVRARGLREQLLRAAGPGKRAAGIAGRIAGGSVPALRAELSHELERLRQQLRALDSAPAAAAAASRAAPERRAPPFRRPVRRTAGSSWAGANGLVPASGESASAADSTPKPTRAGHGPDGAALGPPVAVAAGGDSGDGAHNPRTAVQSPPAARRAGTPVRNRPVTGGGIFGDSEEAAGRPLAPACDGGGAPGHVCVRADSVNPTAGAAGAADAAGPALRQGSCGANWGRAGSQNSPGLGKARALRSGSSDSDGCCSNYGGWTVQEEQESAAATAAGVGPERCESPAAQGGGAVPALEAMEPSGEADLRPGDSEMREMCAADAEAPLLVSSMLCPGASESGGLDSDLQPAEEARPTQVFERKRCALPAECTWVSSSVARSVSAYASKPQSRDLGLRLEILISKTFGANTARLMACL